MGRIVYRSFWILGISFCASGRCMFPSLQSSQLTLLVQFSRRAILEESFVLPVSPYHVVSSRSDEIKDNWILTHCCSSFLSTSCQRDWSSSKSGTDGNVQYVFFCRSASSSCDNLDCDLPMMVGGLCQVVKLRVVFKIARVVPCWASARNAAERWSTAMINVEGGNVWM